jgi:hypothetical protein
MCHDRRRQHVHLEGVMSPNHFGLVVAAAAALTLASCGEGVEAPGVHQIVSTTSFGMCVGYCSTTLEISPGAAVLTRTSRGGRGAQELPDQKFTQTLTQAEWVEISQLAAQAKFEGLPPVIGCPDCADGGAESLTVIGAAVPKTVSFEHGATVEQVQPLLDRVRALRAKLTPKS